MSEEGKRRYSLISVDVADEDEPVVRVDAQGAHVVSGPDAGAAQAAPAAEGTEAPAGAGAEEAAETHVDADAAQPRADEAADGHDDEKEPDELEDLDGSVPFAGMQRAIVVLLVLILAAGIAYFILM